MGYARCIGRVGALAVTLGVGIALASTPPVGHAEPSDPSSSSSSAASSDAASTDAASSDAASSEVADSTEPADPDTASVDHVPADEPDAAQEDGADEVEEPGETADGVAAQETPVPEDDEDVKAADDHDAPEGLASRHDAPAAKVAGGVDLVDDEQSAPADDAETAERNSPQRSSFGADDTAATSAVDASARMSARESSEAATTVAPGFAAPTVVQSTAQAAHQPQPSLISVFVDVVAAVLRPLLSPDTWLPFPPSLLLGVLSSVRNELERAMFRRTASPSSQYTVTELDPTPDAASADPTPNVLVIGVDGTNLSRILESPENENFFALMNDGTTAASSIVGHTTISNPSWTSILTGVWGERTGVINNVFTPWTYNKWPTLFNQLETLNPTIQTTAVADWNVISAIAGAGSIPVDENIYIPRIDGDTNWLATDDAVGAATVSAIAATPTGVPTFLFSYFVGVDENGHMYGGASDQYEQAINNVDDNLGDILAAVKAWEKTHPEEGEWTILMVTDHGHQPQLGFGHGFQSPSETATFVIASGPDFHDGYVNPDYEIIDTTPTVMTLFGGTPRAGSDGVSLTTLGGSDELPADLHDALEAMIAANHSPDLLTNVRLSLRTIFATIPYFVWTLNNDGTIPLPILGDVLYVATNIPAQIVALLTGVVGASIFPLLPPGPPSWPDQDEATALFCDGESNAGLCDAAIVA